MPEHFKLEAEIEALARDLHVELKKPERREAAPKEVLRDVVRGTFAPSPAPAAPPPPAATAKGGGNENEFLPSYVQTAPPAIKLKVEQLIDLAWHEGIAKAAQQAADEGAYFLDAFHDALTDKLYEEFKRKGIIK